jgi:Ca-activated chloride channel family protein
MLAYLWDALGPGFLAPWWLLVGALAMVALVVLEVRTQWLRQQAVRAFAASHLVSALVANVSPVRRAIKALLVIFATGLLFTALARPYLFHVWTDEKRSGVDVLLAVDCSKSMLTQDVLPSRIERAKLAIADLAAQLPADRLGLIAFAGDAFLQCPLTLDHDAFLDAVRELNTDAIPRPGTDIATAIDAATDALRSQPNNLKFVILISDGEDLEGRALESARKAAQNGLKIYTVGVGTPEGDRIPEDGEGAYLTYHHDLEGNEVISHLDEKTMRQIADITGGAYAPLGQEGDGLQQIYNQYIASLPKQNLEEKRQIIHIERFEWPLAAAILFLMWDFLIREGSRARKVEAPRAAAKRRSTKSAAAGAALVWLLLAGVSAAPLRASDLSDAQRAYQNGDYDAAMQDYGKVANAYPARPQFQFDRGDAAYKAGEYSEAEEAFRKALETPNLSVQEQSYYNLGNTQYEHGAALLKVDRARTIELWKSALRSYEDALKLKSATDTQHNYELVKRKLEELMRQQQGGNQGSSGPGQGQSGSGAPQSGQANSAGSKGNAGSTGGQDNSGGGASGESNDPSKNTNGPPSSTPGNSANPNLQAYSGTRGQDLQDPQIRSRQDAENLLDSLQGEEKHITAHSYSSTGTLEPPPSGKDW